MRAARAGRVRRSPGPVRREAGRREPADGHDRSDEHGSGRELIRAYTGPPHDDTPERRRLRAVLLDQLRVSPQQPVHLPAPTDPRLRELCEILRADPADNRTLAALGTEVGATDRTLARLFEADLGMPFPQWRTQLRLYRALVLLADETPVTAVAHACGWSSTSAFIDVFRRAFGYTPGTHYGR